MIAGHFTTALIAKQKFPKGTLTLFFNDLSITRFFVVYLSLFRS